MKNGPVSFETGPFLIDEVLYAEEANHVPYSKEKSDASKSPKEGQAFRISFERVVLEFLAVVIMHDHPIFRAEHTLAVRDLTA